jgi:hypothetical protein
MADTKISALPPASTPLAGTEVLPIVQSGTTSKVSIGDLTAGRAVSMTSATLSDGTANGVAYLNGSKALTTGSALTFDGSQLDIPLGSAAAPALSTPTDPNTGIFFPAADEIAFTADGAVRLTTSASQFTATLPWRGQNGSAASPAFSASADTNTGIFFPAADTIAFAEGGVEAMRIDSSGNVGIGTSSPNLASWERALTISAGTTGDSKAILELQGNRTGTDAVVSAVRTFIGSKAVASVNVLRGPVNDEGIFAFFTAPTSGSITERMRIDSSGNVGIGTSLPSGNLDVENASNVVYTNLTSTAGGAASVLSLLGGSSSEQAIGYNSNALRFGTVTGKNAAGFSERMRIDSSGRLLINATSTSSFFDGQLNVAGNSSFKAVSGSSSYPVFTWNNATTGNNNFIGFYTETSATNRGSISYNRGAGLVAYNTTSDYRAKDIIGPVVDSGVVIDSVPVYMGKMKGATQERPMFIAHEVPAYAHTGEKDAVDADGKPVYQQMDASALVPVMWAEIQSLRARVSALESN